ncbi:acyl-CoA dehydrogenase family protein [Deinococcus rubellus]|uniref:Acyl-CoA/acyl-ACP dehydrogenase n=1 Tax=Deinococcus rubellus TaxID=1889240 RepID=A0ABY5YGL8_9DEIO|nr:acyl-CoA dehydrogenase family protein [Deinococcus rubellus]UWX63237.1 acyl-CoA/acyl-ACP dehydrogenase [Deinococcus rubellus]
MPDFPDWPTSDWPRPEVQHLTARAAQAITTHLAECEAAQDVTPEAAAALKASGYAALCVPPQLEGDPLGGLGATLSEFAWVQEQLGAAGASLALVLAMTGQVLGSAFAARSLPPELLLKVGRAAVIRGALINAVASEPGLGSPSRGGLPQTALTPDADGFRLSGHKTWATGARALDFALVTARTPDDQIARALTPLHAPGVSIETTWGGSLSLRGSGSQDIFLDRVRVECGDVVPPQPQHPAHPAWFWTALAGTYLGVGTATLAALTTYVRERVPTALGQPLSSLPRVREATGRISAELAAARALLQEATRQFGADPSVARLPLLAAAKALCTNAAVGAADQAARVVGGAALSPQLPFERLLRDARAGLTHPPTDAEAFERLGGALLDAERRETQVP